MLSWNATVVFIAFTKEVMFHTCLFVGFIWQQDWFKLHLVQGQQKTN